MNSFTTEEPGDIKMQLGLYKQNCCALINLILVSDPVAQPQIWVGGQDSSHSESDFLLLLCIWTMF